jgi:hypothetical protein
LYNHNHALDLYSQVPARMKSMHRDPGGIGELAAGEGSPELAHKRHWNCDLAHHGPTCRGGLAGDVDGGAVAAGPLRLQFRRGEGLRRAMRGRMSF